MAAITSNRVTRLISIRTFSFYHLLDLEYTEELRQAIIWMSYSTAVIARQMTTLVTIETFAEYEILD